MVTVCGESGMMKRGAEVVLLRTHFTDHYCLHITNILFASILFAYKIASDPSKKA